MTCPLNKGSVPFRKVTMVRTRGQGRLQLTGTFWELWDSYTHELIAAVHACIIPAQDQASQHFITEGAGLMTFHLYLRNTRELMAAGGKRANFFKNVASCMLSRLRWMTADS